MSLSDDDAIERLVSGVIDGSLPRGEWTHAGHFAASLWLCRHRREVTTADAIRTLITRFNDAIGTPNTDTSGYHHTITLASMRAADAHLQRYPPTTPVHVVLASLMTSPLADRDWLLAYWTRGTLFSVAARREWRDPDRASLPF